MNNPKVTIFGMNYDKVTLAEAVTRLEQFIKARTPRMVFTTGAELMVRAQYEKELKEVYLNSDLLTIDSNVGYFTARLLGKPVPEPVSAANLIFKFLEQKASNGYRLYFLGAKEHILNSAIVNVKKMYPKANIAGFQHGYFDFNNDGEIIENIRQAQPDIIFVAMSSPLKEKFISKNLKAMNVPVAIGVGGSVDILGGYCKPAPKWMSKVGLEWFYRFIQEPRRLWKRYFVTNSLFVWLVIREAFKMQWKR